MGSVTGHCTTSAVLLCALLSAFSSAKAGTITSAKNTGAGVAFQTVNPGFVAGLNAIPFNVRNTPGSPANLDPVGLPADFAPAPPTLVPEPATFVLVGFACVALGALRFRRKA